MPKPKPPRKPKPLYRRTAPPPPKERGGPAASTSVRATAPGRTDDRVPAGPHYHPIAPSHFTLRDDGSIQLTAETQSRRAEAGLDAEDAPRLSASAVNPPSPPRLLHHDEPHGLWLYHGNSLELLDAIAAKYPDGRFDCIFADPPYFLSNGGITCHAGRMVKVDKGLLAAVNPAASRRTSAATVPVHLVRRPFRKKLKTISCCR